MESVYAIANLRAKVTLEWFYIQMVHNTFVFFQYTSLSKSLSSRGKYMIKKLKSIAACNINVISLTFEHKWQ